jgi:hypothetical protein
MKIISYRCDWCDDLIPTIKEVVFIRRSYGYIGGNEFDCFYEKEICKRCDEKISAIEYCNRKQTYNLTKENL